MGEQEEKKLPGSGFGVSRGAPASFATSREGLITDWIQKGTTVGARQQRAEALEHLLGIKSSNKFDALLSKSPGAMRAALARTSFRRRAPGPFRNEALAHFYGGWRAPKDAGILTRLNTGLKDMQVAMDASPSVRRDFRGLALKGIAGGAALLALRHVMKNRRASSYAPPRYFQPKDEARLRLDIPESVTESLRSAMPPSSHPATESAKEEGEPKTAMNNMETQMLIRKLKMARGGRGGAQLLRILEARLITDQRKKARAAKAKSKKNGRRK